MKVLRVLALLLFVHLCFGEEKVTVSPAVTFSGSVVERTIQQDYGGDKNNMDLLVLPLVAALLFGVAIFIYKFCCKYLLDKRQCPSPESISTDLQDPQEVIIHKPDVPEAPEKLEDMPVKFQDMPVKLEDMPVKLDDVTVKLEDIPVKLEDIPVKLDDMTVKLDNITVKLKDTPVKLENISERGIMENIQEETVTINDDKKEEKKSDDNIDTATKTEKRKRFKRLRTLLKEKRQKRRKSQGKEDI